MHLEDTVGLWRESEAERERREGLVRNRVKRGKGGVERDGSRSTKQSAALALPSNSRSLICFIYIALRQ